MCRINSCGQLTSCGPPARGLWVRRERKVLHPRESALYEIVVIALYLHGFFGFFFEYLSNCQFLKGKLCSVHLVFKFTFSNIFRVIYSSGCSFLFFSVECVL